MDEKRGSIRYAIKARIFFKAEGGNIKVLESQGSDISYLGFGTLLKESIDPGTAIQFDLTADFMREHLVGSGKVVYAIQQKTSSSELFKIGVKFIEYDKEAVLRFINENHRRIVQEEQLKINEQFKKGKSGFKDFGPY